jgi:hypothetical protein
MYKYFYNQEMININRSRLNLLLRISILNTVLTRKSVSFDTYSYGLSCKLIGTNHLLNRKIGLGERGMLLLKGSCPQIFNTLITALKKRGLNPLNINKQYNQGITHA